MSERGREMEYQIMSESVREMDIEYQIMSERGREMEYKIMSEREVERYSIR